MKRIPPAR